ncbi:MAG: M48 family metallopeptidase [Pseudomonadota bacterium]
MALVVQGRYFDGETAGDQAVDVTLDKMAMTLSIRRPGGASPLATWHVEEVRVIRDHGYARGEVFEQRGTDEARLVIPDAGEAAAIKVACPNAGKFETPPGAWRKVVFWTGGAIAAMLLILFVILPNLADTMATLIPPKREEAIGETVVAQIERAMNFGRTGEFCSTPEADAAIAKMSDRLTAELDLPYPLKIRVLKSPMVNAFAAPGGHVVFMSGLIDKAGSPEEVAGVLAHEIGHVAARDPLRIALRAAGSAGILSLVLGDFAGGTLVLIMAEQVMQASYTRDAEEKADQFAHELLHAAELPTEGFATFFDKLREQYGDVEGVMEYLNTHPNLEDRAAAARAADTLNGDFLPILSQDEWEALQSICR